MTTALTIIGAALGLIGAITLIGGMRAIHKQNDRALKWLLPAAVITALLFVGVAVALTVATPGVGPGQNSGQTDHIYSHPHYRMGGAGR